jgi:hypothetical protein
MGGPLPLVTIFGKNTAETPCTSSKLMWIKRKPASLDSQTQHRPITNMPALNGKIEILLDVAAKNVFPCGGRKMATIPCINDNEGVSGVRVLVVEDFEPYRRFICSKLGRNPDLQSHL